MNGLASKITTPSACLPSKRYSQITDDPDDFLTNAAITSWLHRNGFECTITKMNTELKRHIGNTYSHIAMGQNKIAGQNSRGWFGIQPHPRFRFRLGVSGYRRYHPWERGGGGDEVVRLLDFVFLMVPVPLSTKHRVNGVGTRVPLRRDEMVPGGTSGTEEGGLGGLDDGTGRVL